VRISGCLTLIILLALALATNILAAGSVTNAPEAPPPSTPREFFNAGTQKLREDKLREAEAFLESALASQAERLQPAALYNLGHVRFKQGVQELQKGPGAEPALARGRQAVKGADEAIRAADDALSGSDVPKLVAAYVRGRGARKELKAATRAVRQAMETYGAALARWQRASGDFKSAAELNPRDADARENADTVDRCIAKLVDTLQLLAQMESMMGAKGGELGEKMQGMKGRIPAPDMPPGGSGDDEEDNDQPHGPKPGEKEEGGSKDGHEMQLSPEEAGWLLDGLKFDGDRRLPIGGTMEGRPTMRWRPTW
jgi:tetratricopeptide (TPR) repeat protein